MPLSKFKIKGFRSPREAVIASLGTLERSTLEEVWRQKEVNVRDVVRAFNDRFAYTTVMTTLDRLYKKGYLERKKVERAYVYSAVMSDEQLQTGIVNDVLMGMIEGAMRNVEPVLACIVDAVSDKDRELLDDLERLIKAKKAALGEK
ncbi:MAG: BlaI/MecI/CopY family transcriptional regulator [Pyrinomonadaceae bacterium]|nr:BlaI/MecI/CopY family transcriptional regulator [Chloracidobacterium sp.]MBP7415451.1 BlaI/MecI/CopY family transcriptional regulator [Pyrinomonadaceae bacterium]